MQVVASRLESNSEDRTRFGDPTRRRVARVCRDEALGAYAIGRELGRKPNTFAKTLTKMVADGTLQKTDTQGREQALYQLTPELAPALDEALLNSIEPGAMRSNQGVVLARGNVADLLRGLKPDEVSGVLLWTARLSGNAILLAFDPDADDFYFDKLLIRLSGLGIEAERFAVGDVLQAPSVLQQGAALRHAASAAR